MARRWAEAAARGQAHGLQPEHQALRGRAELGNGRRELEESKVGPSHTLMGVLRAQRTASVAVRKAGNGRRPGDETSSPPSLP